MRQANYESNIVVVTDGAGSPRNGLYENYTDEQMKAVRIEETKNAAMLGLSSKQVKNKNDTEIVKELVGILKETKPQYVYLLSHIFMDTIF